MSAQDFLRSQNAGEPAKDPARDKVLAGLGLSARPGRVSRAAAKAQEAQQAIADALAADGALGEQPAGALSGLPKERKKREGVKETPILTSLRECQVRVEKGENHVAILFDGARLFSLNELFSILQYRPQVVFGYKKLWQQLTRNALAKLGADLPHFEACRLTLYRQGKKKIDRDSIEVMFKFIIDALKDDPKRHRAGLFSDDNPDVVQSAEPQQSVGPPMVGIRVEGLALPPDPDFQPDDLFDDPAAALPSRAIRPSPARGVSLDDLGPIATANPALASQINAFLAASAASPKGEETPSAVEPNAASKPSAARKGAKKGAQPAPASAPPPSSAKARRSAPAPSARKPAKKPAKASKHP